MSVNVELLKEAGFTTANIHNDEYDLDSVAILLPGTFEEAKNLVGKLQGNSALRNFMLGYDPRTKEYVLQNVNASEKELTATPKEQFYSGDAIIISDEETPFLVNIDHDVDFVTGLINSSESISISTASPNTGKWIVMARESKNELLGFLSSDVDISINMFDEYNYTFNTVATVLDGDNADTFATKHDAKQYVLSLVEYSDIETIGGINVSDIKYTYLEIK